MSDSNSNYVPPPPSEVSIRTLASDLKTYASSGGQPQFQSIAIPPAESVREKSKNFLFMVVGIIVACAILAAVFIYLFVLPKPPVENAPQLPQNPAPVAPPASTTTQVSPNADLPVVNFAHASFFKKPPEQLLTLTAKTTAASATSLQTFGQKITNLLLGGSSTSTFSEIKVQDDTGRPLSNYEFFTLLDGNAIDPRFLANNFNPDFTYFVYRDKNGFWPGYILALKPTQNWLFVKNDVALLESSAKIENLFITPPGDMPTGGFADAPLAGESVRILHFPISNADFVYEWTHGYLILSTSKDGFSAALNRL